MGFKYIAHFREKNPNLFCVNLREYFEKLELTLLTIW